MGIKPIPPPRQFYVECPKCGVYRISEETARQFLTQKLRKKLDDRLGKGAAGAKLKFDGGCPNCEPNTTHEIELIALTPSVH